MSPVKLVKKYKKWRASSLKLMKKIKERYFTIDILYESGKALGMLRGKTLVFEAEEDEYALLDYAFFEHRIHGKNIVEIYRESVGGKNRKERILLDALASAYTSLFEIVSVSPSESTLLLRDILNEKEGTEKLVDVGLSSSALPGYLAFLRLIKLEDFCMTSGIGFLFPPEEKNLLLKRSRRLKEKITSKAKLPRKLFTAFYKWNKTRGIPTIYI